MANSVVSSPVRSTTGSPAFRSQRKLSAGTIMKKIQTLEDTIESLRQQLVFTRTEDENIVATKEIKKPKQLKEKMPKATATIAATTTAETKQKKIQNAKEEEKDKIPMPWTGLSDFATCVGLKAQYGLFIQCGKACDTSSASFQIDNHECRFCKDCSKKCDEHGKHPVGTIEERIEAGVGKYVNVKTGKKETLYIEVLEKMGITKEQALESAARRGLQIPDWMLEKAEKKRGRPAVAAVATVPAAVTSVPSVVASQEESESKPTEEKQTKQKKEVKPRQPRVKKTANVETHDTPQKKNSVQGSICIELNQNVDEEDVTPVAAVAAVATVIAAAASTPIPQEKEKKKRGRPTKSNTQSNVAESEMQQLIAQATTEKKKRLSLDPDTEIHVSNEDEQQQQQETNQVEAQLTYDNEAVVDQNEDDAFELFDILLKNEEEAAAAAAAAAAADKKKEEEEADKKKKEEAKKKKKEEADKKKKEEEATAVAKKKKEEEATAAAAKKKKEEEAAAAAAAAANDEETEDEDEDEDDEEEELECEEYEYDGETYGLAPNGDIYSQDGDLVGKLANGVPKMFN